MTKESVNTPYDDAFRTLLVKCPTLVIPLVNEAFHEKYELWENVSVFHNEFFVGNERQKERITDSHIGIRDKRYHTECQSSTDGTITVRIFEYDAQIAAENARMEEGNTTFVFPIPHCCTYAVRQIHRKQCRCHSECQMVGSPMRYQL